MPSRPGIVVALLLAAVALPIATAGAQRRPAVKTVESSRHLWATVNACDPAESQPALDLGPGSMGIRASMPGSADGREDMYMRFRAQFLSEVDDKWHNIRQNGDSGYIRVGKARYKARQSGFNFRFPKPAAGETLRLRGKVNFEWRLRGEVTRRAAKVTTKGHRSSAGAYPRGYSEATCTIRP